MAKFTCFDLSDFTTIDEIPTIAEEINACDAESAAEKYANKIYINTAGECGTPIHVVVRHNNDNQIWEVSPEWDVVYHLELLEHLSDVDLAEGDLDDDF